MEKVNWKLIISKKLIYPWIKTKYLKRISYPHVGISCQYKYIGWNQRVQISQAKINEKEKGETLK